MKEIQKIFQNGLSKSMAAITSYNSNTAGLGNAYEMLLVVLAKLKYNKDQ